MARCNGQQYNKSSAVAEMGDHTTAKWAEKWEWGCCSPFREEVGSPSNTMPPGPRPTSVRSGILIHPAVWPQYTNVTDRQTRQIGQRSRSIGRVTCNCRPKSLVFICVRARYMDKRNGDGVETENSFTFGVIEVAESGPEEATSGLAKLFPVERQPLPVRLKPQILPSELSDQQSESLWTVEKYSW